MNGSVCGSAHRRPLLKVRSLSHSGPRRDAFFSRAHRLGQLNGSNHHEQDGKYTKHGVKDFSNYLGMLSIRYQNEVSNQRENGGNKRRDHIVCLTHDALRKKKKKLLQIGNFIFDYRQKPRRAALLCNAASLFADLALRAAA